MHSALSYGVRKHRPFLIAGGVLAIASVMLIAAPRSHPAPPVVAQKPALMQVLVATHAIAMGTTIAPADFRSRAVSSATPAGAILARDAAIGRIAARNLAPGELLTDTALRDAASAGIAAYVAAGQRAFAIRVAQDEIVGGFLQSADRVDVLATIPGSVFPAKDAQDHPDRSRSLLLLQDVLVLAVGENLATKGAIQSGAQTVSLSLTPPQLARLTLALRFGKISLAIRNPGDTAITPADPVTLADLVPQAPIPVKPAPPPRKQAGGVILYAGTNTLLIRGSDGP